MSVAVLKQLVTPLSYLRITSARHEKLWVDLLYPAAAAAIVTLVWARWPEAMPFRGGDGLLSGVGSFMQVLVGFYVAGLAAVATFPRKSLDQDMVGIQFKGKPLPRRQFLSYMFGYLALVSLAMLVAHLLRAVPTAVLSNISDPVGFHLAKGAFVFVYQFMFWQMILITLLGIHFLAYRIHVD
ncbi:hypothetical protein [uncultured Luteimonas sp.]|uniref:hypothetical protein n=1 Tax=uncultured Luteimonas sp. TaxID=453144 RepID=UPI002631254A|nr:hypothetical protein [uncultured Luteimonas sp.]